MSPDTKYIVTGEGNAATVWESRTGSLLSRMSRHTGTIIGIAFNTIGTRLLTMAESGEAIVWTFPEMKPVTVVAAPPGHAAHRLVVNASGDVFLRYFLGTEGQRNGVDLGSAELYSIADGQRLRVLKASPTMILKAALMEDGSLVATADPKGLVTVWDQAGGKVDSFQVGRVMNVSFSLPLTKRAAGCSHQIRWASIRSGTLIAISPPIRFR